MQFLFLLLGFFVGALGTMIGAGGGFVLVPALLLLFPSVPPEVITATSLAVVFANSTSGSIAYGLKRKIDYKSGFLFAAAGIPGVIFGAGITRHITRGTFDPIFGVLMAVLGGYLAYRKIHADHKFTKFRLNSFREITSMGETLRFGFNRELGLFVSVLVGFLSAFLGIGGGIIHVPALVLLLNFPVNVATATSHFILMLMSGVATLDHALHGSLAPGVNFIIWLAPGVIFGAQFGAWLSHKVRGTWIVKLLGFALMAASLRFILPLIRG